MTDRPDTLAQKLWNGFVWGLRGTVPPAGDDYWRGRAMRAERLLEQRTQERDEARADELDENLIAQDYHASFLAERERVERFELALRQIESKQQEALSVCRKHGFVFDSIGTEPGNWQHLAFTLYTYLCEIDSIVSAAFERRQRSPSGKPL